MGRQTESRPKVLVVVGTRPEGIKMVPVVSALREQEAWVETRVAFSGQHQDLLESSLRKIELRADWDLGIMRAGQDLYDVAHGCLDGLRDVVRGFGPDMVLVQGDTATVMFTALVAFFEKTRVGHVEAGLRTDDKWRPYPEEVFRRLTGVLGDLHFAPTQLARRNLLAEHVPAEHVHVTGNTVVDVMREIRDALENERPGNAALSAALASGRRLVLVTAHRRESFGEPLREVFSAIRALADAHDDAVFLYPVHPNPNVREPADALLSGHDRILLTEPLDYLDLQHALYHAVLALTDSGGIQEEAPSYGTPVLVLRETTERPEGILAGAARLVGHDREAIMEAADELLDDESKRKAMIRDTNPYGDGWAGERIAGIVVEELTGRPRTLPDWAEEAAEPVAPATLWFLNQRADAFTRNPDHRRFRRLRGERY